MKLSIYSIIIFLTIFPAKLIGGDNIKVVTTLPDLKNIVEEIGGTKVEAFSIATGFQNPHFVDPKPSYILKLTKADMFVTVGLDLETGWSPSLLNSSRNTKIQKGNDGYVDASKYISLLQIPNDVNRASGDIHVYGNPHYWLDPMRGIKIGQTIYEALIKLSPSDAKYFESNYISFKNKLDVKIKEWSALMTPYKGTKIIAYHNEWPYFEERFGLRIVDFLEPKPGIPPTPGQLSKVINEIKEQNIKVIISSPYFTTESADLVARQSGAKVVVLATSVGADKSIINYFDLFDYNIKKMIDALK